MPTRREFLTRSGAVIASAAVGGCSYDQSAYVEAVANQMRPLPANAGVRDLIRYATLAANGHNTQPWKFRADTGSIQITPDLTRRTPVVDPDDHHLFASLGCAAENLRLAARARGKSGEIRISGTSDFLVEVGLEAAPVHETSMFRAIPDRQCSRVKYDGRPAPADVLSRLETSANRYGVETRMITAKPKIEAILALVVDGNTRQLADAAFVSELKTWIRFNADAALASRDGLYTATSANPTIPSWLGKTLFDVFLSPQSENEKYVEQIRSSAGIAVFTAKTNDKEGWFNAGRAFQCFALQATVDGLKLAFINQAVEVLEMRRKLQTLLGIGERRPNFVVRFGYGPIMPRSLRRPVADVMI